MYGVIGRFVATSGQRDALIDILLDGIGQLPGCRSYVVAEDPTDPDGVWITEVWDSAEAHEESLTLPAVKRAIERAMPLIASFAEHHETAPVGGIGIDTSTA